MFAPVGTLALPEYRKVAELQAACSRTASVAPPFGARSPRGSRHCRGGPRLPARALVLLPCVFAPVRDPAMVKAGSRSEAFYAPSQCLLYSLGYPMLLA